jgi:hypothetical protein
MQKCTINWLDSVQIQRFDDLYDAHPSAVLPLGQALDAIVHGRYTQQIQRLRALYRAQGEEAYARAKRRLPQYTFCGRFAPTRSKANLTQHSGIVHADLDHLTDLTKIKLAITSDPSTVYCFTSPRGDGLKYGVRIAPVDSDAAYQHAWQVIADAQQRQYTITWDASGRDVCRLCYVSWDPAGFINPAATVCAIPAPPPAPRTPPVRAFSSWPSPRLATAAARALEAAVQMIEGSQPGAQHSARCRAAYLVGGYIAAGQLDETEALTALSAAVQATAQHQKRAMRDITDGLAAGQARPITSPSRLQRADTWLTRARTLKEVPTWRR